HLPQRALGSNLPAAGLVAGPLTGRPRQPPAQKAGAAGRADPHHSGGRIPLLRRNGRARRSATMKLRVRSIFTKIVVWFVATVTLSLVGYVATSVILSTRLAGRDGVIPRLHTLFLDDARRAYEEGGSARLAAYLHRLDAYTESR